MSLAAIVFPFVDFRWKKFAALKFAVLEKSISEQFTCNLSTCCNTPLDQPLRRIGNKETYKSLKTSRGHAALIMACVTHNEYPLLWSNKTT